MSWLHWIFGINPAKTGLLTAQLREHAQERWAWITEQIRLGKPSNLKLAIIEADKLTDEALKLLYPGREQMAERLKLARAKFYDRRAYDDLWYAHKVRNVIVHETSYDLTTAEATTVLEKYHAALISLGVL